MYGVCVNFPLSIFKCLVNEKVTFQKKNTVPELLFEKCRSLSLPGNATMLQHLIFQSGINKVPKLEKKILVPGNIMLLDG